MKSDGSWFVVSRRLVAVALAGVAVVAMASEPASKARPETGGKAVVGQARELRLVPDLDQAVEAGGERIWSREVAVPGAAFLRLHLVDVKLRQGDWLAVVAPDGRVVDRITGRGPKGMGTFWTLSVFDERLLLEAHLGHDYGEPPFRADLVMVGDPAAVEAIPALRSICNPPDFEYAVCSQSDAGRWANVLASAGVMTVGGDMVTGLWCSGSNVSPLNYVLTNYHCIGSQSDCDSAEFVFNHYKTVCGDSASPLSSPVSFRCDQLVVSSPYVNCDPTTTSLDFALSSTLGDPAADWGFVLPDPNPLTSGEAIYIVQHPNGRPHEITQGDGANVVVDGHTIRYYDTLDTEPGSSGSPIFREADDLLVGLHHCGGCDTAGVGNRGMLMSDIYPLIQDYLCSQSLDVAAAGWSGLAEVAGNGDAVLDPGETWSLTPLVRNRACAEEALNVAADVAVGAGTSGTVVVTGSPVAFGDVPAASSAAAQAPVQVEIAPDFPCGGGVELDLVNLTAGNGGPFPDAPGFFTHPVGEVVYTTLFFEDFSGGLPGAWTVVDGGTNPDPPVAGQTWTTDPTDNSDSVSLTAPFAMADSDGLGSGYVMDEELISPVIDCSGFAQVELRFAHVFHHYSSGGDEQGDVDVRSSATGGSWVTVANYSGADASGAVNLDITAQAGGQTDVQVRFHYYQAEFDWYWAVDDVTVLGNNGLVCNVFDPGPTAALTGPSRVCAGSPVQFQDASTGATSWSWDFDGDGTEDATGQVPPPFSYASAGTYTCRLTVTNDDGSDTAELTVEVIGATSAVPGDTDGDGSTAAADLAALLAELGDGDGTAVADRCQEFATTDQADTDGSGQIEPADLDALLTLIFG